MYSHNRTIKSKTFKKLAVLAGITCMSITLSTTLGADDGDDRHGQKYQTANIVDFETGVTVAGAATLTRTKKSATARIYTTGLQKKAAYTIWWVVWNKPGECIGGCGEDDIGVDGNSVFYAGGFVTGNDGSVNVSVHVKAGSLAEGIDVLIPGGLYKDNGFRAEIHLIIRSHGKIIPGMADVQVSKFEGACDVNKCIDHQAVAFVP